MKLSEALTLIEVGARMMAQYDCEAHPEEDIQYALIVAQKHFTDHYQAEVDRVRSEQNP